MPNRFRLARMVLMLAAATLGLHAALARAALGLSQLPATQTDGPVTMFYPTDAAPGWPR